jgi:SAM-dependent methyltransferase
VIAVDSAPSMVERARASLPADRVEVLPPADLVDLELEEEVDAVFSNAVFHWVPDHDALFARLHAALKPGGRLVIADFVRPDNPAEAERHDELERRRGHQHVQIYEAARLEAMLAAAGCPVRERRTVPREMDPRDWLDSPNVAPGDRAPLAELIAELEPNGGAGFEARHVDGGVRFVRADLVLLGIKA